MRQRLRDREKQERENDKSTTIDGYRDADVTKHAGTEATVYLHFKNESEALVVGRKLFEDIKNGRVNLTALQSMETIAWTRARPSRWTP